MHKIRINTEVESKKIFDKLISHNVSQIPELKDETLSYCFNIKDENGEIVAGVLGRQIWNFVEVSILWVDETYRSKGLGKQLLDKVETQAQESGCIYIHLDTFAFQALEFYRSCGYKLFGQIDHPKKELTHYFLVKLL